MKKNIKFWIDFFPILFDFGLHFGAPAVRDSLVWATMAALGSCLALCWAIFRVPIRFLARLGSIFHRFSTKSGLIFWFSKPFFNNAGGRSLLVRSFFFAVFVRLLRSMLQCSLFLLFYFISPLRCSFLLLCVWDLRADPRPPQPWPGGLREAIKSWLIMINYD